MFTSEEGLLSFEMTPSTFGLDNYGDMDSIQSDCRFLDSIKLDCGFVFSLEKDVFILFELII